MKGQGPGSYLPGPTAQASTHKPRPPSARYIHSARSWRIVGGEDRVTVSQGGEEQHQSCFRFVSMFGTDPFPVWDRPLSCLGPTPFLFGTDPFPTPQEPTRPLMSISI